LLVIDKTSIFISRDIGKGYFPKVMRQQSKHISYHIPMCLLLFILVGFLYLPTIYNNFVHYDTDYILNNSSIQSVKKIPLVFTSFLPTDYKETYRPVTALSYMMDYLVWKTNPMGFHITNILLHMLASILCYAFFWHITGKDIRTTLFSSVLFAIHPLLTESVAWISGRSGILGAVFLLSAFLMKAADPEEKGRAIPGKGADSDTDRGLSFIFRKRWKIGENFFVPLNLVLLPLFYLLGMLSWEYCIIFPMLMLGYDLVFHREKFKDSALLRRRLLEVYAPLAATLVLYLLIRSSVQAADKTPYLPSILFKYSRMEKPFAPTLFAMYLLVSLYPLHLTLVHVLSPMPNFWISLVILLGFIACLVYVWKKIPVACFGLIFFLLCILSLVILPLDNLLAERMMYPAIAGFCLALGATLVYFSMKGIKGRSSSSETFVMVIFLCLLAFYGVRSYTRNKEWVNGLSIWTAESNLHPKSAYVQNNLGLSLYTSGQATSAQKFFEQTIEIDPLFFPAYHNLARIFLDNGRREEAKKILDLAAERGTNDDDTNFTNIALLYMELGQTFSAEKCLKKAVEINPHNVSALSELGSLFFDNGQYKQSIEYFTKALENVKTGDSALYLSNRGTAYYKSKDLTKAVEDLEEAMRIAPDLANPYLTLAAIEGERKFGEKSVALLEEALQKVPSPPFEVYFALHQLYSQFNQPQKAFDILLEYQKKAPNDFRIQMALGQFCLNWYENVEQDKRKLENAATCFKNAHKLDPRNKETLKLYGKTAALMGQKDAAEKIWRLALKIDPNDAEVKRLLQDLSKQK